MVWSLKCVRNVAKRLKLRRNVLSYDGLVKLMYKPCDPASLGVIRLLFGFLMMLDLPEERAGAIIDLRWGNSRDCHFPLFSFLKNPGYPYVSILYGFMWMGALGIMLGYNFRSSALFFGVPYWFLFILDKTYWNNHSYLFGIITLLLAGSSANHYCSLDGILDKTKNNAHVPYWNYFILKYQFFLLYFLAGLKKMNMEWLDGYAMVEFGSHWVFLPFRLFLTPELIEFLVIHWFGFILDLTICFWMLYKPTRSIAMMFCALFHLMNSRLFSIGMFPYVCLVTMPLFCSHDWPRRFINRIVKTNQKPQPSKSCIYNPQINKNAKGKNQLPQNVTWKHRIVVGLLLSHCGMQVFLPYSHFITKGYNNWTNGLYGYSWDMMVHSWDTVLVVAKIVDNDSGQVHFLDPGAFVQNERWSKHADMCVQYAQCVKNIILRDMNVQKPSANSGKSVSKQNARFMSGNISIYLDVWCSLNGRFQQRMYDPNYDLIKANWSPFKPVEWLLPLLTEYNDLRSKLKKIQQEVYSWSNYTDVLFISDFPGLYLENFIVHDITNVTLTVLEGSVVYEIEDKATNKSYGVALNKSESVAVQTGIFHKVHTISTVPSCYMYTFTNMSKQSEENITSDKGFKLKSPFPLVEDMGERLENMKTMFWHIRNSIQHLLFGKPLEKRVRLLKNGKEEII